MEVSVNQFVGPEPTENNKFQSLLNTLKGHEEFVLDRFGIIISSNLEAVTITGYEEWEVIGKHISIFYSAEDRSLNKPEEDLSKAAKLGKSISSGFRIKKRGDKFWAKMKFVARNDSGGFLKNYHVTLSDFTHRAMYSMSTRRIKDEYFHLFNNSFIGIFKYRIKDYTCLVLNEKATTLIDPKLKLNELFYHPREFDAFLNQLNESKRVENFEFRLNRSDREMYCSICCKLFVVGGFIEGVINDITQQKSQLIELQKVNDELDNFIYRISHDIRAPLATILGLVNLMQIDKTVDCMLEYTQKITERVQHLDGVLRALGHVTAQSYQNFTYQVIDIANLIEEIVKHY